jgi:hypothetical protein
MKIPEFPDILGKAGVNGQNSDLWGFGKGALNELPFYGVAVLQSYLHGHGPRARFMSTKTILKRGPPSAVIGPNDHGHEHEL